MCSGRPNTPGERKDRLQGEGRVRAAAANAVNPSAAEECETLQCGTVQDSELTVCARKTNRELENRQREKTPAGFLSYSVNGDNLGFLLLLQTVLITTPCGMYSVCFVPLETYCQCLSALFLLWDKHGIKPFCSVFSTLIIVKTQKAKKWSSTMRGNHN